MRTNPLPEGSQNLNGRCARYVESMKLEGLSKFLVFQKRHPGFPSIVRANDLKGFVFAAWVMSPERNHHLSRPQP